MKNTPNKLYVVPMKTESQDAFVGLAYELDKLLLEKTEYIRKNTLIEWAKEMKRICRGAKPIEKAYQTMIDKIESL